MPHEGGTISLAPSPGSLVRLTFLDLRWHSRKDFRLQPPRSKRGALYIELREHEMVPMAGLAPALDRF